ncbi:hypothetical protein HHK36_028381 [Tetracentron sinense]|uniref:Ubiquitin-like protease family profile domain-containing protein n=1 Tax=Tetracentron sinense TaxID=13715 RepID=A0A835D2J2_TETSI|nr:hypothetical protein HHK36_028381 [Tetracentron sinense]
MSSSPLHSSHSGDTTVSSRRLQPSHAVVYCHRVSPPSPTIALVVIWACERIPSLTSAYVSRSDAIQSPRILNWHSWNILKYEKLATIFNTPNLKLVRDLVPTNAEAEKEVIKDIKRKRGIQRGWRPRKPCTSPQGGPVKERKDEKDKAKLVGVKKRQNDREKKVEDKEKQGEEEEMNKEDWEADVGSPTSHPTKRQRTSNNEIQQLRELMQMALREIGSIHNKIDVLTSLVLEMRNKEKEHQKYTTPVQAEEEVEVQVTQAYSTPPMREAGGVQVTPMEQDEVQVTEAYVSPIREKEEVEVQVTPAYSTSPMREVEGVQVTPMEQDDRIPVVVDPSTVMFHILIQDSQYLRTPFISLSTGLEQLAPSTDFLDPYRTLTKHEYAEVKSIYDIEKREWKSALKSAKGASIKCHWIIPMWSSTGLVDDEGIDIYMEFLEQCRRNHPDTYPQDCSFARCWFMQLLQSDLGTLKKYSAEKDTVKRYAIADSIINGSLPRAVSGNVGERSMWTYEKIYIPFNVRGNHWILAMVKPRTREIFLMDSMYEVVEDMYTEYIDALVEGLPPLFHITMETNELEGDESKVVVVEGLPKQPNK